MQDSTQPHVRDIQTLAVVPLAPVTLRSTKFPSGTTTDPVAEQEDPEAAEQTIPVSAKCPGVPCRSITVIVFDCCENTLSFVAVHPAGIHVSTGPVSVAPTLALFTE